MCGIVGVWAREHPIPNILIGKLFESNSKRGRDGWGFAYFEFKTLTNHERISKQKIYRTAEPFNYDHMLEHLSYVNQNSLLFGICRAKPETEVETQKENLEQTMQPIERDGIYVVHNGSINTYYEGCENWMKTKIDSECIIYHYKRYGFPEFVKHIPGGFAFILYDSNTHDLIIGVNHMPLYHMYVKGIGYFVSSVKDALEYILSYYYTDIRRNTYNVWEAWYLSEVSAFSVRKIDLDSGMISVIHFEPCYLLPNIKQT
jgi:asparagine synthetase B (glutamine-hydrolysing)